MIYPEPITHNNTLQYISEQVVIATIKEDLGDLKVTGRVKVLGIDRQFRNTKYVLEMMKIYNLRIVQQKEG